MSIYTDKFFVEELKKIVDKYDAKITYLDINTRQFWLDCSEELEGKITFEIEKLIRKFISIYPDFEKPRENKYIHGWSTDIGSYRR